MSYRVPIPINEPIFSYAPGTGERQRLKKKLAAMSAEKIDIPLVIGGKEVRTGDTGTQVMPHRHGQVIATWHKAGTGEIEQAIRQPAKHAVNGPHGILRIARVFSSALRIYWRRRGARPSMRPRC
jgi:hypothetical protein